MGKHKADANRALEMACLSEGPIAPAPEQLHAAARHAARDIEAIIFAAA